MGNIEAPTSFKPQKDIIMRLTESKSYELNCNKEIYSLLIELYSDDNIYFKLRKSKDISLHYYMNKCTYEEITKLFLLQKEHYTNLTKVFHFFDMALAKKKINLEYNQKMNLMLLKLNKTLDFDAIECKLELKENKIAQDEMYNVLIEEINDLKNNKKENKENNEEMNEIIKKNKEYEKRIANLEDKIKLFEEEINKLKELINEVNNNKKGSNQIMNDLKNKDEQIKKEKADIDKNNLNEDEPELKKKISRELDDNSDNCEESEELDLYI